MIDTKIKIIYYLCLNGFIPFSDSTSYNIAKKACIWGGNLGFYKILDNKKLYYEQDILKRLVGELKNND